MQRRLLVADLLFGTAEQRSGLVCSVTLPPDRLLALRLFLSVRANPITRALNSEEMKI